MDTDDELAALERAERDAWAVYRYAGLNDYEEARDAWNAARANLLLARRDG